MSRRVVIAPDSFKGTCAAGEVAGALADGWRTVEPSADIELRPMADGGEGTLEAFAAAVPDARRMPLRVTGPAAVPVDASWLLLPPDDALPGGTGVVELASTSGIELLTGGLRGRDASTIGFGQAIRAALDHGVSRLVLGIGSSASTDGGIGLLTALGARFTDEYDVSVPPGAAGLDELRKADLTRLRAVPDGGVLVLTDVTNALTGPEGAARVFGPQKGLDDGGIERAEAGLERLAGLLPADPDTPGAGAAGGAGFGLLAWGARLVGGAAEIAELTGLTGAVHGADVVITGEGSYDGQSAGGKTPSFVVELGASAGARVAVVAGRVDDDAETDGIDVISLTALSGSADAALSDPVRWLRAAGERLARDVAAGGES
ncbi:glycerate kinase [Microbacterium marinilacus]|uniref:Glycerate kinase n=1 Tax=Microbacterium marinilacus TaxID=415209 RepID=A0ABP7BBF9_9MICO|nr:glycerate kinase [Microbacterium marinilacus]MBY0686968.1 glycerate kinase [Microbacterium marinilacus]